MGDSTQPQQKYAGTGENCNIVIAVNFANMLKIVQKPGKVPDFRTIFNKFAKLIFALKFNI